MQVKTVFGEQIIDPNTAISFPNGLPGFENCKRFKLFHQEGEAPLIYWLQSLDQEDIVFSVADPLAFGINYEFTVSDEEELLLGEGESDNLLLLILIYKDESDSNTPVKGSVRSPLIINVKTLKGIQKVLNDDAVITSDK